MDKIRAATGLTDPGPSGIGVDQSSLSQDAGFLHTHDMEAAKAAEARAQAGVDPKQMNSSSMMTDAVGKPTPEGARHESAWKNALDPRVGYTDEEIKASAERYEQKHGKPTGEIERKSDAEVSSQMKGLGTDQSALFEK